MNPERDTQDDTEAYINPCLLSLPKIVLIMIIEKKSK